jgi:hypothetical protein
MKYLSWLGAGNNCALKGQASRSQHVPLVTLMSPGWQLAKRNRDLKKQGQRENAAR